MKLRLTVCAIAAGAAVFAGENDVTSESTYAVMNVTNAYTDTVIAVPWVGLDGGNITISNLVNTSILAEGDKVYMYSGNKWYACTRNAEGQWDSSITVSDADYSLNAASQEVARGAGLVLQRASTGGQILLCGRYSEAPVSTSISANATTLIANPKTVTAYITDGTEGDQIRIPGNGGAMKIYEKKSDGWYTRGAPRTVGGITIESAPVKVDGGVPLEAGKGAFYTSKGARTINW